MYLFKAFSSLIALLKAVFSECNRACIFIGQVHWTLVSLRAAPHVCRSFVCCKHFCSCFRHCFAKWETGQLKILQIIASLLQVFRLLYVHMHTFLYICICVYRIFLFLVHQLTKIHNYFQNCMIHTYVCVCVHARNYLR